MRKTRPGYGKSKGANFERLICVQLSNWLTDGKQDDCLWRSSMSGGRSTVAHAKGKRMAVQAGDITGIDEIGLALTSRFFIECKFVKDLKFSGLITGKGPLIEFWETACEQAAKYTKHPMMIAKQNQLPVLICLSLPGVEVLQPVPRVILPHRNMYAQTFDSFVKEVKVPKEWK